MSARCIFIPYYLGDTTETDSLPYETVNNILLTLLLIFVLGLGDLLTAQDIPIDSLLADEPDTSKLVDFSLRKSKFTPIIAPVVSPEVDFMLLAAGLFTFVVKPSDPDLPRSSIPFSVGYSTNGSLSFNVRPFIYGQADKYRLYGDIWVKDMPDHYFGVGYDNGRNVEKSDSTTFYQRFWWQMDLRLVRRIVPRFYAGGRLDVNRTNATEVNPQMMSDPDFIAFGPDNKNSGIGIVIQWDSRDLAINAYSGIFLNMMATFYGQFLRGQNNYNMFELDYRHYKAIGGSGRTLTWQVRTVYSVGEVPWAELPKLGTPFDLRGYRLGQYRDETILFGLMEYRHMFTRREPDRKGSMQSRHGLVTWVGTGSLAQSYTAMKSWLPNVGVGYRFAIPGSQFQGSADA